MNYKHLSDEQKQNMVDQRLLQLEAEHFQHTLNIDAISRSSDSDEQKQQAIEAEQRAIAAIESAHGAVSAAAADLAAKSKPKGEK